MTREDTIKRLLDLQHQVGALIHDLKNDAGEPSIEEEQPIQSKAYFDSANNAHLEAVHRIFDRYQLSPRRREWFINRGLHGVRMFNVADEIAKQVKIYEERFPRATRTYAQRANSRSYGH